MPSTPDSRPRRLIVAAAIAVAAAGASASAAHAIPGDGADQASGDDRTFAIYCEGQWPPRLHWPDCHVPSVSP
jgi:hypothetical protein